MARRKTSDKKGTGREVVIPKVQADNHSIAFEEIHVGGNVGGDIRIGHTIGYTAEQVSVLLKQITTTLEPKKFDGRCPYKGLEVFEEEDAELFFGRQRLVDDLISRVKESRTVFITGPSGSGKSSLVRAGLIYALKQGAIKNSDRWLYETMKPGREPIKDLALAFSRLKSPELEDYFLAHASETDILNKCAESVLSGRKDQRFVLFIDQFEEVFTQINGEEERVAFINMLAHAGTVENGRVVVLFAMRSDFVSNCATYPALNELLSQEFRQIGAMQPEELVSAIALPARHVGLPIEDELIARIINDMKGEPGALPLMQFALKDLFDSQQEMGGIIALRLDDYLKHGGIHKSLERHADATFAKLSESEQELTRSIFSGLIEIGRGTQDTKRTALFDELIPANTKPEEVGVIVQKLADARLIITDEQAGRDTVTISHEKLIEAWPWLKKLVNENRDVIALQNEIAMDAKEWDDRRRDHSYLYTGARLTNAREQLEAKKLVLSGLAYEFVQAASTRRQRSRIALIAGISSVIVLLLLAVIVFSTQSRTNANTASTAEADRIEAEAQKANAQAVASTSQAIAITAQANAEEAQKQTNIAVARQLPAQAEPLSRTKNSKHVIAVLLAIQSMRLFPSVEAFQILDRNLLSYHVSHLIYGEDTGSLVSSIAFSPDGKYVVSGSGTWAHDWDNTARIWEVATGKVIAYLSHDQAVQAVAFSPDGSYVVSGGVDNTARVWEVATGKEIARMSHDEAVLAVAFSPDGKYVVSTEIGKVHVWDAETGKKLAHMTHGSQVNFAAFSLDSKSVISAGCDELSSDGYTCIKGSVRIWETLTSKEVHQMIQDADVSAMALSPDGKYGVSGSSDGTSTVWELETGREIAIRISSSDSVVSVAFSPDGKYIVSGYESGYADVWEAGTGKKVTSISKNGSLLGVGFGPNGNYVVSVISDGTARVWDATTGREISIMVYETMNDEPWLEAFAFSPDGKYVALGGCKRSAYTSCNYGSVYIGEIHSPKTVTRIAYDLQLNSVVFSPAGKYFVSTECDEDVLPSELYSCKKVSAKVWEISTGKEVAQIIDPHGWTSIAFSPDDEYIISTRCEPIDDSLCAKGIITVWGASTGKEVARMTHDSYLSSLAFSPDSKYILSGWSDHTVRLWEASTGKEIAHIIHDSIVISLSFSPDGKYIVSGDESGAIVVWEATNGMGVSRMVDDSSITKVAFSPNGKYVVSGNRFSGIHVWEAITGNEISSISFGGDAYTSSDLHQVSFSPDSKYVLTVSCDQTIVDMVCLKGSARLWETDTGKEVARMVDDSSVPSVVFSPDGKYLLTMGEDKVARVWVAVTGQEVARQTLEGSFLSVTFSPDGKYIVSKSSSDRITVTSWEYRAENLIADACSRVTRNLTIAEWKQYVGDALPYQAICPNLPIEPEITTP